MAKFRGTPKGNKAVPYGCFGDTLSYIHNNRILMEENKMFENTEMSTDYTIAHHWVPLELFNRLGEVHPNGEYTGITDSTVIFQVESERLHENWFLNCGACAEWYKQNETEPITKTEEEE
jgi:hypothetical protein